MNTPNVTTAQVTALLTWIISVVAAFGAHISQTQSVVLIGGASFVAGALHLGDAVIRHGRSRALVPTLDTTASAQKTAEIPTA